MATKKVTTATPRQPRMSAQEKKWQAEDDLRVMQRAEQIKSDPTRMKAAQREANSQVKALQKVVGKK